MDVIKIQIPSLTENIRIVESFIDNAKEKFHFNDDIYGNIMIAVTESVNNAIVHGNLSDKNKNVSLSLELDDNSLKFTIEDQGVGFNYNDLTDPTAPENLEKIGGRGIFLMKHLCDEVTFHDEGKKVQLSFYLG
ncbi:ATP-binding protein [Reichenbachiella sp. MALMAid0571]|uniref:ATP-binding protein n=1 Tax=Reichenbachiella sp. MALMAid0571 TaxID=3143939 RepID=UPI0032E01E3C